MIEARFSPRPGAAPQSWRLEDDMIIGPDVALPLGEVTGVVFTDTRQLRRLDLASPQRSVRFALTKGSVSERAAHLRLCRAIAERLAELHPQLRVTIGMRRRLRSARFALGAAALASAAGIALWASAAALTGDAMALAAAAMLLLGTTGYALVRHNAPWGTGLSLPVPLLPGLLSTLTEATPGADR